MSVNYCPSCGEAIEAAHVNVKEGVALCPACKRLFPLSEIVASSRPIDEVLSEAPRGCRVREWGNEIVVCASMRSVTAFLGSVFAAGFWNGIVSIFVLLAAASLYTHLIGPLPDWFPVPDSDEPMSLGMTLFMCIFLIPFVCIGAMLAFTVLLSVAGKVVVRIGSHEAEARSGVGVLSLRRRFDPTRVQRVNIEDSKTRSSDQSREAIVIHTDDTVQFGSGLPDGRREWMRAVLQVLLVPGFERQRDDVLSNVPQAF